MQMPDHVKKDLRELESRVATIQQRYMEACRVECAPFLRAIQSIHDVYPTPMIIPQELLKDLTNDTEQTREGE